MITEDKDKLIEQESEKQYKKAKETKIYPVGIKEEDAWDNYILVSNQWKKHIQRYYKFEYNKVKIVLDLAQNPEKINEELKKYTSFTKERLNQIKKINQEIWNLVQKSTLYKKRAFGEDTILLTEKGFIPDEVSAYTPLIIDLAGRYYKAEEIHKTLIEDMDISSISLSKIKNIISSNSVKVSELREKFKKDYSDIRLGYKKSRLEELTNIYNERKEVWENNSHSIADEQQLLKLIEQIKKETEGDLVINADLNIKVENKANEYIQKEILKSLNIQMIILGRICGKMNVNPNLVLSRLANSRYAQFSGLGQSLSPSRMSDDIDYASELVYNWNNIKTRNESFVEEEKKMAKLPDLSKKESNLTDLKEKLKEKLRQSRQPLEDAKEEIKKKQK